MPIIHELSDHLADLIAAGEVVERPASVAKELIENAIDAQSSQITVEIQNGGISYLRIADNGCGMERDDAPIAFRRHATSKLRTQDDLAAIGTLGFRGEALAAIASVSRIDLFTKQKDMLAGTHLHLEAGVIEVNEEVGCPDGTTMIVRDLFYNTPARMKFLRKDFTEAGYVVSVVQHAAMSHPEIAFTMIRDGKQIFATPGNGKLIAPIFSVFGKEMTSNLLEVKPFSQDGLSAWGYITKAHAVRPNRSMQHFFVNGRYVKSRVMQAAMEEAYRNRILTGKYPSGALFLTIPLHAVDVNVHPAKTEVKFAQEKAVFDVVYVACKNALEKDDNIPQIKAATEHKPAPKEDRLTAEQQHMTMPVADAAIKTEEKKTSHTEERYPVRDTCRVMGQTVKIHSSTAPAGNMPLHQVSQQTSKPQDNKYQVQDTYQMMGKTVKVHTTLPKKPYIDADDAEDLDWDYLPKLSIPEDALKELYQEPQLETAEAKTEQLETSEPIGLEKDSQAAQENMPAIEPSVSEVETAEEPVVPTHRAHVLGEAFRTYIVAEDEDGLLLIDKHAAHERMLFNQLRSSVQIDQQELLPSVVEMTATEYAALSKQLDRIRAIGFELEPFGQNCFTVRAIPACLDSADVDAVLSEMADKLINNRTPEPDCIDDFFHTVACKAAVKAGMVTSLTEMQKLCNRVLGDPDIVSCPHGRPVTVRLTKYELDKMFKRVSS